MGISGTSEALVRGSDFISYDPWILRKVGTEVTVIGDARDDGSLPNIAKPVYRVHCLKCRCDFFIP